MLIAARVPPDCCCCWCSRREEPDCNRLALSACKLPGKQGEAAVLLLSLSSAWHTGCCSLQLDVGVRGRVLVGAVPCCVPLEWCWVDSADCAAAVGVGCSLSEENAGLEPQSPFEDMRL